MTFWNSRNSSAIPALGTRNSRNSCRNSSISAVSHVADAPGCSQSLAGLLSVPLTLLGPPAINNNAYAKGVHLAMALAADRRQANLWHLRPTGQDTSLHGGGTRRYGGTRGDAAGSKGAVCGAMHAAMCGTLPKSALRSAMSILAAVLALDDRALPPRCHRWAQLAQLMGFVGDGLQVHSVHSRQTEAVAKVKLRPVRLYVRTLTPSWRVAGSGWPP